MTRGKLVAKSGRVIVDPCLRTTNMFDRLRGLLLRAAPDAGAGLLIDPCDSVHTFFMPYAIDVVYLDEDYRVLGDARRMRPWRMSLCRSARMTLELAASEAARLGIVPDLELVWQAD